MLAPPSPSHPLRRTRPKSDPDPGGERISWDEALNLAAAIRRSAISHGPEAVALTLSSGSTAAIANSTGFIRRFANAALVANGDWVSIENTGG